MKNVLPLIIATAIYIFSSLPGACQYGPFAELPGNWSGDGTISMDQGQPERISCKAVYVVSAEGNGLQQTLKCAGSFPIDLQSSIVYRGGVLSGTWSEAHSNASGDVHGRAGGGRFDVQVHTDAFDAKLVLITYGNVQSVKITSSKQMREIAIRLVRAER